MRGRITGADQKIAGWRRDAERIGTDPDAYVAGQNGVTGTTRVFSESERRGMLAKAEADLARAADELCDLVLRVDGELRVQLEDLEELIGAARERSWTGRLDADGVRVAELVARLRGAPAGVVAGQVAVFRARRGRPVTGGSPRWVAADDPGEVPAA